MPGLLYLPPYRRRQVYGSTTLPTPAAPATPNTPFPATGGIAYYSWLTWLSAGATQFDIFLGTASNPPLLVSKYVGTGYAPVLLPSTTYFWKITAFNDGGSAVGPIWSFTTLSATQLIVTVAGALTDILFGSLNIHDVLNAAPNMGGLTFLANQAVGRAILIGLGSLDATGLIFSGEIQSQEQTYEDSATYGLRYPVNLIDQTFVANKRRPFGTWTNTSATLIAQYLVTRYAPGITANGVQGNLPTTSINFDGNDDFMTCIGKLAAAINGYCYVDYGSVLVPPDLHLFITESTNAPDPVNSVTGVLNGTPIRFMSDIAQARTRCYGRGHVESVPCDLAINETAIPIPNAAMFNPSGGRVVHGTVSSGAQTEIATYTGVQLGGLGSLIGPGVAPTVAPPIQSFGSGLGIEDGVHSWAYTWKTAPGESLPSPLGTATMETLPSPPNINGVTPRATIGLGPAVGITVTYAIVIFKDITQVASLGFSSGCTALSTTSAVVAAGDTSYTVDFVSTAGSFGRYCALVRFDSPRTQWYVMSYILNGVSPGGTVTFAEDQAFQNNLSGAAIGFQNDPWVAFATINRVRLNPVAVGPSGTTQRKIYRTAVGSSQLKLQQTIADNTTLISVIDQTPDASLGANVPTTDTSALTQPTGQVNAGSASILTAGAAPFSDMGGWAQIGSQVVRYTGISGNSLTGVPTSGSGSITATVKYGEHIDALPALIGVNASNGLRLAMLKGSNLSIFVQVDDLGAQIALGLLELDKNGNPTDGIREYEIIDERMNEAGITAKCTADLAQFSRPIVSATYVSLDIKTRSGKTVPINALGVIGNFVIQDVSISIVEGLPHYAVTASSVRFSFMDLLTNVALRSSIT